MKRTIRAPMFFGAIVVFLGIVCVLVWARVMAPPRLARKPASDTPKIGGAGFKPPTNREEGMRLFRGGR